MIKGSTLIAKGKTNNLPIPEILNYSHDKTNFEISFYVFFSLSFSEVKGGNVIADTIETVTVNRNIYNSQ